MQIGKRWNRLQLSEIPGMRRIRHERRRAQVHVALDDWLLHVSLTPTTVVGESVDHVTT